MADDLHQRLHESYPVVAKDMLGPIVELMTVGRDACSGDLDKCLIMLLIATRTAEAAPTRELNLDDVLSGAVERYPSLYTNVRSVAESTGIPRETVRRKVADLVERGWVARTGDDLALTPFASQQLTPMRDSLFNLAGRLAAVVERVRRAG